VLAKAFHRQLNREGRHYIRVPKALLSVVREMAALQEKTTVPPTIEMDAEERA
jgi:hypothetical protein